MFKQMIEFVFSYSVEGAYSSVIVLPFLLAATLVCLTWGLVFNILFHPLRRFPGPVLWRVSCLPRHFAAARGTLDRRLVDLHDRYGDVVRFSPTELSFNSDQAWQDIYCRAQIEPLNADTTLVPSASDLPKDPNWYSNLSSPSHSANILTANTEDHVRLRRSIAPAFSEAAIQTQEPIVRHFCDILLQQLYGIASHSETDTVAEVGKDGMTDMVRWFNFLLFDLAGVLTIGQSFSCLSDADYHPWVAGIFRYIKTRALMAAGLALIKSRVLLQVFMPKSIRNARAEHELYVERHGSMRWEEGAAVERKDLLYFIYNDDKTGENSKAKFSKSEFLGNCNFLMRAGSETVATALSGTLFYLLKNPNKLHFATTEVRSAFEADGQITFQSAAAQLPYLTACIREALRLYPPGPGIFPRRTPAGTTTLISGYLVPGDTVVGVHMLAASRCKANFANPNEFHPERWLSESNMLHYLKAGDPKEGHPEQGQRQHPATFQNDRRAASQAFSVGPRNCIGQALAWHEMRYTLARLLLSIDFELLEESRDWDDQRSFTIWEKTPLRCRVRKAER